MTTLKNRSITGSAALVATILTIGIAAAPLRAEPASLSIPYGDLDVESRDGAAELDARIGRAARQLCGWDDAGTRVEVAVCRRELVKAAREQFALKSEAAQTRLAAR